MKKTQKKDRRLRSDGKPRATAEQITAARRIAAAALWDGHEKVSWRTIRVHSETYRRLDDMRTKLPYEKGRAACSWDALFSALIDRCGL